MAYAYSDINLDMAHTPTMDLRYYIDVDAINQSIKNILLTRRGELISNPAFGSGIMGFLFEKATPLNKILIRKEIELALSNWEPRITVNLVDVSFNENDVEVYLQYTVILTDQQLETYIQVELK